MKTRLSKIGLIVLVVGFAMMFGNFIPPCEPNSMIQTLWTRACDIANVILFITANILSYVVFLIGLGMFLSNFIIEKMGKIRK
jgi:hypothetical protein